MVEQLSRNMKQPPELSKKIVEKMIQDAEESIREAGRDIELSLTVNMQQHEEKVKFELRQAVQQLQAEIRALLDKVQILVQQPLSMAQLQPIIQLSQMLTSQWSTARKCNFVRNLPYYIVTEICSCAQLFSPSWVPARILRRSLRAEW